MKKTIWILIILFSFYGCDKLFYTKNQNVAMISAEHTDCKGLKSTMLSDTIEMIKVVSTSDKTYLIEHIDVKFNCCLSEGICINTEFRNDTIYFSEYEKIPGECRCMCSYDVSAVIGNLDKGEYVLCMTKDNNLLGTTTLLFKEGMYEEILISELED